MRSLTTVSWLVLLVLVLTTPLCGATYEPATLSPPKPQREFRGVWVATVKNIDWPTKPGLSTAEQKAELLAILDRAVRLKLNAIIFQVRPMCDALYGSPIEPWSQYLTGTMGKPPQPFYDPLVFAVAEAHKRGLELHAWFNPYRALVKSPDSQPSANHVSKNRPELVRDYGKYLWLDPGEKEVQDHSLRVVLDVVKRYDVDGVHFDDYFYPYREKGPDGMNMDFPDAASWKKFGAGGKLSRADWRRENVNGFVERVYESIKQTKPWVKFGISPFGIWRPKYPRQIQGMDAYEELYCDPRKWLVNGWVDYLAPQLYWRIEPPQQSFPVLLKWWTEQNKRGRHLWVGMNTASTVKGETSWPAEEILNQIKLTRRQSGVSGHVHWNMTALSRNHLLTGNLSKDLYAEPALIPATPWLRSVPPAKPDLYAIGKGSGSVRVTWNVASGETVWLWLLQVRKGEKWSSKILPGDNRSCVFTDTAPDAIALSAVDRLGNTSSPATLAARK
jgi:uncharacterized lipoprotein YddW (UPF0748 family)